MQKFSNNCHSVGQHVPIFIHCSPVNHCLKRPLVSNDWFIPGVVVMNSCNRCRHMLFVALSQPLCVILIIVGKWITTPVWISVFLALCACIPACVTISMCVCVFVGLPVWMCAVFVCLQISVSLASLPPAGGRISAPNELAVVVEKGPGWLQINPFVFTLLTGTLFGGLGDYRNDADGVNRLLTNLSQITLVLVKIQA